MKRSRNAHRSEVRQLSPEALATVAGGATSSFFFSEHDVREHTGAYEGSTPDQFAETLAGALVKP